jgi:tRNA pseudouridine38-40 synthase
MRKVALKVAYIGTDFHGFQRQPHHKTIEGELISALRASGLVDNLKDCGYAIAGRTDRGVHALGNVISFRTEEEVMINRINDLLPNSIRILALAGVPFGFKPRYAKNRHYRYVIANGTDLDLKKIKLASEMIRGTHDFSNFSKRSERNPLRTVESIETFLEGDILIIDVMGESFLWNMVRKIATALFMVGLNQLEVDEIKKFLDPSIHAAIAPMAPEGLILVDTIYEGVKFKYDKYAKKKFISIIEKEYMYNQTIAAVEKAMINNLSYF